MSNLDETLKRLRKYDEEPYRYIGEPKWCDICEGYGCKGPYGQNFWPMDATPWPYFLEFSQANYNPDGGESTG